MTDLTISSGTPNAPLIVKPKEIDIYQKKVADPNWNGERYIGDIINTKIGMTLQTDQTSYAHTTDPHSHTMITTKDAPRSFLGMWVRLNTDVLNLITAMNIGLVSTAQYGLASNYGIGVTLGAIVSLM